MNIRQRILASGAIGIVAVVLLGGVGFWGQLRLGKALSENELSVNALRNHMEGDMMHDALRADVLAAFVVQPGDGAAAEQVREDLQEHSQWFRKVVEQNQGLPLNDAIHQALVELRRDPVISESSLARAGDDDDETSRGGPELTNGETPEALMASKEIAETVNAAIEALSEDLRQAITLREIEGLSYEEIAALMNCPIGTVRSRIFRARESIAQRLRPLLGTRDGERW